MVTDIYMLTTHAILELLRENNGWSDFRISRELEVSQQAVSKWRVKSHVMSDAAGLKAAKILKMDPEIVVLSLQCERNKNTIVEPLYRELVERLEDKSA